MKFAYLITSYNNFKVLAKLVELLDDPRNDIFIHFDKKTRNLPNLHTNFSKLVYIANRIDVRWGTYSQIQSYFELYREAHNNGPYDYYHLLSGTTLPLKSQDYLHSFFEKCHGQSLVNLWKRDDGESEFKLKRIHFWIDNFQSNIKWLQWCTQRFWTLNMFVQKRLGIRINKKDTFHKADCWVSLSDSAIKYLLENESRIARKYKYSFAGDEYYVATELMNNPMTKVLHCPYLLYRVFEPGEPHPKNLTIKDFNELQNTEYLFARKFSDNTI